MALDSEQEIALLLFQTIILLIPIYLGISKYIMKNIENTNPASKIPLVGIIPLTYIILVVAAWELSNFLIASIDPSSQLQRGITLLRSFFVVVGLGVIVVTFEQIKQPIMRAVAFFGSAALLVVFIIFL